MSQARSQSAQHCNTLGAALIVLAVMAAPGLSFAAAPGPASALQRAALAPVAAKKAGPRARVRLIDINSASRAELKTLPGVGDAQADSIVDHRPYLSKADLATKKVIPTGVYVSLKNKIIAIQKGLPKGKT